MLLRLPRQTHRLGGKLGMEGTYNIGLDNVAPKSLLVEFRVHIAHYFGMQFRQLAPMHRCSVMMRRMQAIVEQHPVCGAGNEVARMVPGRLFVGMYVLDVVEYQHREKSELLRDNDIDNRLAPVQYQANADEGKQRHILPDGGVKLASFVFPEVLEVLRNGVLLKVAADARVAQQSEGIVLLADAVSDGVVAFLVVELMVVLIVRRRPAKSREAIE